MYSPANKKQLITHTSAFLVPGKKIKTEAEANKLREVLRFHEYEYYINATPILADKEYDDLFKKLEEWEFVHVDNIPADSPTQRIATALVKDFPKREHLVPMLSLNNSYNAEGLHEWDKRNKQATGLEIIEYCVEPKFDGASISLFYQHDHLVAATTRGDGVVGDEITTNAKQIRSIPLSVDLASKGIEAVEIRGEVMMNKKSFAAYNRILEDGGLATLANPRNAAAGSLRMKDSTAVGKRKLEAFMYNIGYERSSGTVNNTHFAVMQMLQQSGFKTPLAEMKVLHGIEQVIEFINEFEIRRDELDYEIDGMVIKVNDLNLQDKLGMTSHHPRWAMAYKYKARQAESILQAVEYQVGRTGAVTPVAKIKPVQVSGVTVSNISIHNEEYIREKDLRLGDHILIERSGDVIPQIIRSMVEKRTGEEVVINFPKSCPVCKHELHKPDGEAVWRCINISCEAQVVEKLIHFVSKDAMDIRSLGESNVRKFYDQKIITDIPSIYKITADAFTGMEGFGEKSVQKLLAAIEQSKTQPLHRLIYALGIRYVGETTAKTLAQKINDIFELAEMSLETLQSIDDVGVKVGASITMFFEDPANTVLLKALQELGVRTEKEKATSLGEQKFSGKTFLFTGTLSQLKRSDAEAYVEAAGGKIMSGVSSKLTYLVVGEDAGSKLEKAKKLTGITIIDEAAFIQLMEK